MSRSNSLEFKEFKASAWIELCEYLTGLELVSIASGPAGEFYALAVTAPADYRMVIPGAIGPKITTNRSQDFAVFRFDGAKTTLFDIRGQHWNFHFVQPLPDGELLLVGARSHYRARNDYDLNGKVFAEDGTLKREFLLGDGIEDVQTTDDGRIWVSYFDEGVFGNFGWRAPVGTSGLVLWDKFGSRLYEFSPSGGLDIVCDCYALNVVSNKEAWCYYYTQFPLVRIREGQIDGSWECPIAGSDGFVLWKNFVLFRGGYRQRDEYHLVELMDSGRMKLHSIYRIVDEDGVPLCADKVATRGCCMFLLKGTCCYRVDVRELIRQG